MNLFRHITKHPIRVALALSLAIHLATLWKIPALRLPRAEPEAARSGPLIVQLEPRAAARPQPAPSAQPPPAVPLPPRATAPRPVPPRAVERRPAPPPVIARSAPAPAPPPRTAPAPAVPPPAADFASYVEARRRARGETIAAAPPASAPAAPAAAPEDANARANRIAAANLGIGRKPSFGPERNSGGVFDLKYTAYDYAEFVFYGWNKDIRRDTAQTIEVRKGKHPDIRLAVVRRMIAIIREHEKEDFVWQSHRLNRDVTLSARPRDTAGLEAFLIEEFFGDPRRPAATR